MGSVYGHDVASACRYDPWSLVRKRSGLAHSLGRSKQKQACVAAHISPGLSSSTLAAGPTVAGYTAASTLSCIL